MKYHMFLESFLCFLSIISKLVLCLVVFVHVDWHFYVILFHWISLSVSKNWPMFGNYGQRYIVLTEKDINERQEEDIGKVSAVLSIRREEACVLLHHYKW